MYIVFITNLYKTNLDADKILKILMNKGLITYDRRFNLTSLFWALDCGTWIYYLIQLYFSNA